MPIVRVSTFQIGLSPLARWLVLSPLVLSIVRPERWDETNVKSKTGSSTRRLVELTKINC